MFKCRHVLHVSPAFYRPPNPSSNACRNYCPVYGAPGHVELRETTEGVRIPDELTAKEKFIHRPVA
jgi:hypothetical protein